MGIGEPRDEYRWSARRPWTGSSFIVGRTTAAEQATVTDRELFGILELLRKRPRRRRALWHLFSKG